MNSKQDRLSKNRKILSTGITSEFCTPSHYPISKLIHEVCLNYGKNPLEVAMKLELKGRRRAAKRLNHWIADAEGHKPTLEQFAELTGHVQKVEEGLRATKELIAEEIEAGFWKEAEDNIPNFYPHIIALFDATRPKWIFGEAITKGRMRRVPWEACDEESVLEARIRAGIECEKHYQEKNGECWNWRNITGYCFVEAWNQHVLLDVAGNVIEVIPKPYLLARATISIRGRSGVDKLLKVNT